VIDHGKRVLLGVAISCVDYEAAVERVLRAARGPSPLAVSALAVHGVMCGVGSATQRYRLNRLDMVTPDGQPVRWALNALYRVGLADQVHGAVLTARLLVRAEADAVPVFFYGSRRDRLERLAAALAERHPRLRVAGVEPSLFCAVNPGELDAIAARIRASGARICFVGLGCPRQELFVSAMRDRVGMPILAVGAAFDYLAGGLREPPGWMRRHGWEWAWRLVLEPRRLWRRYLLLNPAYVVLVAAQAAGVYRPGGGTPPDATEPVAA
jgi:N-acetylglucosaminyldiphosphoundecaprenol N-acetyl-beta-D-mannosaminyltransferase